MSAWLDKRGLAAHLACSVRSVESAVAEGIPHAVIFGRVKFQIPEVEAWLEQTGWPDRKPERPTLLYAIQAGEDGPIKVGISTRPKQRLQTLQTASAARLRMLAAWPAGRNEEASLHSRFGNARLQGEWFRPVPELIDYVLARRST